MNRLENKKATRESVSLRYKLRKFLHVGDTAPREFGITPQDGSRGGFLSHPLIRKYVPLLHEDLTAVYVRDLRKWLIIAPLIGVTTGVLITAVAVILLHLIWEPVLSYYLSHHWAIVPGLLLGFIAAGLIMQLFTPDPDEHSTEEIIRSYHEHQGDVDMRPFLPKLLAAIATVGCGGSAALEGPSIYGGGAIGSWLWARLRSLKNFHLDARDRRIMLICGAAAGMSAVFRAPLTGIWLAAAPSPAVLAVSRPVGVPGRRRGG